MAASDGEESERCSIVLIIVKRDGSLVLVDPHAPLPRARSAVS